MYLLPPNSTLKGRTEVAFGDKNFAYFPDGIVYFELVRNKNRLLNNKQLYRVGLILNELNPQISYQEFHETMEYIALNHAHEMEERSFNSLMVSLGLSLKRGVRPKTTLRIKIKRPGARLTIKEKGEFDRLGKKPKYSKEVIIAGIYFFSEMSEKLTIKNLVRRVNCSIATLNRAMKDPQIKEVFKEVKTKKNHQRDILNLQKVLEQKKTAISVKAKQRQLGWSGTKWKKIKDAGEGDKKVSQ